MHAAKINHLFVANTRWRHHSICVLRLDLVHFIVTCKMDIPYFEEYRIVSVNRIINFAPEMGTNPLHPIIYKRRN